MVGGTSTQAHLKAQTCGVLQRGKKDISEHGMCGRNRKEASPHVPWGPNQSTLTDLAQQHNTSNMGEPVGAKRVAQGPGGTGRDHSSNAEIQCGEDGTPGQDPIPNAHGCIAVGVQTMALSDL